MTRRPWSALFAVAATAAALSGCHASPRERPIKTSPIEEGAGTITAARKYLEGRWSLQTFEVMPPGRQPLTVKGSGTLVFDEFANLRMELRPDAQSADLLAQAGIPSENGVISQEGRVAVDMQNHTLTYVMQGGAAPGVAAGPLATNRPRHWQVDGDILTLTTKGDKGETLSVGKWQKSQLP